MHKPTTEQLRQLGHAEGQPAFMQALTTEHFTLQTARAVAVSEGNGRTALYLGALSSTLVALALVAQRSLFGDVFHVVALTVLPAVFFLGLVTYVRILQSSIEDIMYARAINRIRHFYTEIDPSRATTSGSRAATTFPAPWPTWDCGTPGPSSCSPCRAPWP